MYLKSLKDAFFVNYPILWINFFFEIPMWFSQRLQHTEKWKSKVDKGKSFGALLTDLSKAFDCISHELLPAKLHAYRFSIASFRIIHIYLKNRCREQR